MNQTNAFKMQGRLGKLGMVLPVFPFPKVFRVIDRMEREMFEWVEGI